MGLISGSHWWYVFHKEVKSWHSTSRFRICQFHTPVLKAVSSNASPRRTGQFLGVTMGVFWKKKLRPF
jgi:hypothetical protein